MSGIPGVTDEVRAERGMVFQCTRCLAFAKYKSLLGIAIGHTHQVVERYTAEAEDFYVDYHANGHSPTSDIPEAEKIEATPASEGKTHGVQPPSTIEYAYKVVLKKEMLVTGHEKLTLAQMQELQAKFEEAGYQVTELKYEGVVEV